MPIHACNAAAGNAGSVSGFTVQCLATVAIAATVVDLKLLRSIPAYPMAVVALAFLPRQPVS